MDAAPDRCTFLPPYLLVALAESGTLDRALVEETLQVDARLREGRSRHAPPRPRAATDRARWTVHTAAGSTRLPGDPARAEGEPATGETAVDEAADGITATLDLFREVYRRDSYDDAGARVLLTVHYGRRYANAFWDGSHLVFGDGDGMVFGRFTASVDVLAHEFGHAVTEHTAGLVYAGQSGALNESVSDVFAACTEQRIRGQGAEEADWLIGAEIFRPGIRARALRDMADPGTAYDDPRLGKDPQPAHMDDYVVTDDDNGGVHINSGIPNRAFVLAARAIGGSSAEGAGRIWLAALDSGDVRPTARFAEFAAATVAAAGGHADAVAAAWRQVGVEPAARSADRPGPPAPRPTQPAPGAPPPAEPVPGEPLPTTVEVRRSGGFIGQVVEAVVDLDGDDPRCAELRDLVGRRPLRSVPAGGGPVPDGFVYDVRLGGGTPVRVPEQQLTGDLRRLVDLVLDQG